VVHNIENDSAEIKKAGVMVAGAAIAISILNIGLRKVRECPLFWTGSAMWRYRGGGIQSPWGLSDGGGQHIVLHHQAGL